MVTGYEADFYRQFGQTAKDLHRIAFATEGIVVMLKQLVELKKSKLVGQNIKVGGTCPYCHEIIKDKNHYCDFG